MLRPDGGATWRARIQVFLPLVASSAINTQHANQQPWMIEQPWRYLFARPPSPRCLAPKISSTRQHTHTRPYFPSVSLLTPAAQRRRGQKDSSSLISSPAAGPPPLASPAARPPENATRRDARPYFLLLCWPAVFWLFLSVCARLYGAVPPRDSLSTLCRPPSPAVLTHWPADHPGEPPTGDSLLPLLPFLLYPSTGWLPLFSFRDYLVPSPRSFAR